MKYKEAYKIITENLEKVKVDYANISTLKDTVDKDFSEVKAKLKRWEKLYNDFVKEVKSKQKEP